MAKLEIDITKSIEENAGLYYEKAKKLKRKLEGAKKALEESRKKLEQLERLNLEKEKPTEKIVAKKEWYEKFRWFISSEGFLVIGGRDATSNEIVVKKHTDKDDIVFHTDMTGSPFFVIKNKVHIPTNGKSHKFDFVKFNVTPPPAAIGKETISEAADATVTFSKAWKLGMKSTAVFYCKPEQLTKEAPPGEYIPRGGFVTKGKLSYIENKIDLAVGITKDGRIMAAPLTAIKKNCEKYLEIEQGKEKTSKIAKQIQYKIGGNLDDIIRALPAGGCKVKK